MIMMSGLKSAESSRAQQLRMLGFRGSSLPAGMQEEIKVINVMEFVRAAEAAVPGSRAMYDFLCDISHPTYMHMYFFMLTRSSWSNELCARETHRILEEVIKAAEMTVKGISAAVIEIYKECLPDIEKEIASYAPSPAISNATARQQV